MSQSVYVASPEGMTGKSIVAFGLLEALASRSDRVGVFRPVVKADRTRDYAVDLLTSPPAVEQAYRFQNVEGDEESVELAKILKENSAEEVVTKVNGIEKGQPLFDRLVAIVKKVQGGS